MWKKRKEHQIGYKEIFKQREFIKLMAANIINRFGDSIDSIAFTWLVYTLTSNATWSAVIYGINKVPTIFLQPIAGAIVENKNKKFIMIFTDIIRGICVCYVALAYGAGFLQSWMLIIITLIISSVEAFRLPSASSIVPNILKKENFEFGISLNSTVCNTMELFGLGIAGIIIAKFGIVCAITIDAITFIGSALMITTVNTHERNYENKKIQIAGYIQLLKDGGKYIAGKRIILNFIIVAVLANAMLVPINSMQAPLVKEVLNSNESMLSILSISISVSMLISTVTYPYISKILKGKALVLIGGTSFGLYYLELVGIGDFITNLYMRYILVCVATFAAGYLITLLSTYISVSFLKVVEPEYIARAAAIMNAAGASAIPIVSFIISLGASIASTKINFMAAGILLVIIMPILTVVMEFEPPIESNEP